VLSPTTATFAHVACFRRSTAIPPLCLAVPHRRHKSLSPQNVFFLICVACDISAFLSVCSLIIAQPR